MGERATVQTDIAEQLEFQRFQAGQHCLDLVRPVQVNVRHEPDIHGPFVQRGTDLVQILPDVRSGNRHEAKPKPAFDRLFDDQSIPGSEHNVVARHLVRHPGLVRGIGPLPRVPHKIVLIQIRQIAWCLVSFKIGPVREQAELQLAKMLHHIVIVLRLAPGPECYVRLRMLQLEQGRIGDQRDPGLWMISTECLKSWHQHVGDGKQGRDDNLTGKLGGLPPHPTGKIVKDVMRAPGNAEKLLPGLGQMVSPPMPDEEPHAKLLFQCLDVTIYSCTMHAQNLGSLAHRSFFGDAIGRVYLCPCIHLRSIAHMEC